LVEKNKNLYGLVRPGWDYSSGTPDGIMQAKINGVAPVFLIWCSSLPGMKIVKPVVTGTHSPSLSTSP